MQDFLLQFLSSHDVRENLATEAALFTESSAEYILLWRNTPCVVIGCNQEAEAETSALGRASVPVARRITGGGAVYHDLRCVNFSFIQNGVPDIPTAVAPVMDFLRSLDLPVEFSGRNDILLHGLKISGCAQRSTGERTLTHGTLLFRRDAEAMEKYLTPSSEKLLRHGVSSVRSRTGELSPFLPQFPDAESFMRALGEYLKGR